MSGRTVKLNGKGERHLSDKSELRKSATCPTKVLLLKNTTWATDKSELGLGLPLMGKG